MQSTQDKSQESSRARLKLSLKGKLLRNRSAAVTDVFGLSSFCSADFEPGVL